MSQRFDPITGEPIPEGSAGNTVGFDPITGQPVEGAPAFSVVGFDPIIDRSIVEENPQNTIEFDTMTSQSIVEEPAQAESSVKFDPMTGKPVTEGAVQAESSVKFDPMTGKPVIGGAIQQESSVKFDPITGKPVREGTVHTESTVKFDPMTGLPLTGSQNGHKEEKNSKKFNLKLPILIGAAAAAVVVIAVVVFILSGAFLSKQNKVLLATANTFKDSTALTEALEGLTLLASDSFTLSANVEVEGESIKGSFASKGSEMQLSAKVDMSGIPELEGVIGIDSKAVRARVEGITDYVFVYNYNGKNNGYLLEQVDEDDLEIVNTLLKNLTTEKKRDDLMKDVGKACLKEFNNWEFKNASKEEFEINGKDRKCKGYTVTVTEDNVLDLIDSVYKVVEKTVEIDELEDVFSDLEDEFNRMPDIETTFYIYDNMLAAIVLDVDGDELEVLFHGGDTRWQNTVVKADNSKVLELKGKTSNSVEKYALKVEGSEVLNIEYNAKSGALEVEAAKYMFGSAAVVLEANVKGNADKLTVVLESIKAGGNREDIDLELTLKKGADMKKISGKEFDLGNADEDDFEELRDELFDYLY